MKKLFCLLIVAGLLFATSCSKTANCTCKEKNTGYSQTFTKDQLDGYSCKETQKLLNDLAAELGENQNWSCK